MKNKFSPMLQTTAQTENIPPDWYFLYVIFKNVDADYTDSDGIAAHTTYTMTQEEVDFIQETARSANKYMDDVGVMRTHAEFVEIDTPVTGLEMTAGGPWISSNQAAPLLEKAGVNLDKYDHVFCSVSLNVATKYGGLAGAAYKNGTGHSCINIVNREVALTKLTFTYVTGVYVHEFLHFMEHMSAKWGAAFDLHSLWQDGSDGFWDKAIAAKIILDQAGQDAETGMGVVPAAWQYPPHVLRAMQECTIPEGVTTIGHDAFLNCSNLESVIIPDSVTTIDASAFNGCSSLKNVTVPGSVTSIGRWAFAYCSSLEKVTIPGSVTSIGRWAFAYCSSLESVTIPGSVTDIKYGVFRDCGSLKNVIISNGVATIGHDMFLNCSNLESVIIPDSVTIIDVSAFNGCSNLKNVTVPGSVTSIGRWAFAYCSSLEKVSIPSGVTTIGDDTFRECTALAEVTIPDSVTSIGDAAFYNCTALTSVSIPISVAEIGYAAFHDTGLTDVYYGGTQAQWEDIQMGEFNSALINANIHYNSTAFSDTSINN